jgi:hypothetical protein
MIAFPISPDALHDELEALSKILARWTAFIYAADSLPGVGTTPGTEEQLDQVITPLKGELLLVARRCEALAEILDTI